MIKPIGNKLVVDIIREEQSSLILLSPEAPQKGRVISTGSKLSPDIKVGMTVSFARYAGTPVRDDEKELLILEEKDILAYE